MILLHWAEVPETLPARVTAIWLARLPAFRSASLERALDAGRGLESLTGLALLAACAQYMPLPPLSMLCESPGGKPRWPDGPDFSIAHAAGLAVCAIAPPGVAIGVDLESADGVNPAALRLVTSAAERSQIAAGILSATALWTSKEAVLKAAGAGFVDANQVEIEAAVGHHAGRKYHLKRLDLDGRLVLTVATTVPLSISRVVRVATSTLFDTPSIASRRRSA